MSDGDESPWKKSLLEIEREKQKQIQLPSDHLLSSKKLYDSLLCELARQKAQPAIAISSETHSRLEAASIGYVLAALTGAGWKFECGKRFSTSGMASKLGVIDQHRRLLGRLLEMLCEEGFLRRTGEEWEVVVEPGGPDLEEYARELSSPEMETESALFRHCAPELAQVLRGECLPLELLFPDGDIELSATFYYYSAAPRMMNHLIGEVVRSELVHFPENRNFRILEVGAGTGSATSCILPLLAERQAEYVFTDISRYFFKKAQERLQGCSCLSYRILDIEQEPQSQGFETGGYDLVVAANVLHATRDLRKSLDHVRRLLRPGGMLALLEITGLARWMDLVFGLTTGWWLFTDRDLRPSHPLLPLTRWKSLLNESGFEQVVAVSSNDNPGQISVSSDPGLLLPLSVITARKKSAYEKIPHRERSLIFGDQNVEKDAEEAWKPPSRSTNDVAYGRA